MVRMEVLMKTVVHGMLLQLEQGVRKLRLASIQGDQQSLGRADSHQPCIWVNAQ